MEPKDKAKELIDAYKNISMLADKYNYLLPSEDLDIAKIASTIAVEEIIKSNPFYFHPNRKVTRIIDHSTKDYWEQVKLEIKNFK